MSLSDEILNEQRNREEAAIGSFTEDRRMAKERGGIETARLNEEAQQCIAVVNQLQIQYLFMMLN